MDYMFTLIKFSVLAMIAIAVLYIIFEFSRQNRIQASAENLVDRALNKFPTYRNKPAVLGEELVLLMDESKQTALVATAEGNAKEIPFADFTGIEVLEDGHTVSETRRKGTLGRAAAGGLLAGGVGAVLGAVSAGSETRHKEVVSNITVAVRTEDASFPVLAWCTFAPTIGLEHMSDVEVQMQRRAANDFAAQFAPIFAVNAKSDPNLNTI